MGEGIGDNARPLSDSTSLWFSAGKTWHDNEDKTRVESRYRVFNDGAVDPAAISGLDQ